MYSWINETHQHDNCLLVVPNLPPWHFVVVIRLLEPHFLRRAAAGAGQVQGRVVRGDDLQALVRTGGGREGGFR